MASQFILQGLEEALAGERTRLVRLCAALTGNVDVAEDLAQEVLLEAWRGIEGLREAEQFSRWLSGIARNVCLRWARKQGRQLAHLVQPQATEQEQSLEELLVADFDIEVELERKELVELLDRALAMLPPATREVLVARYIEESSLAEVAERLGLQTGAVAMRLQRGKLALRKVLSDELAQEWQEYGLQNLEEWEETSVWCTQCGRHHLLSQFRPAEGKLWLACPECGEYSHSNLAHTREFQMFVGMKRVKPAITRLRNWIHTYYRHYLPVQAAPCMRCGQMIPLQFATSLQEIDAELFSGHWLKERGVYQVCRDCQLYNWTSLEGLVLALPEGQTFVRDHPRIRTLPEQQVGVDGQTAFLTRFESITDQARLEVVSASETFQVLRINGR